MLCSIFFFFLQIKACCQMEILILNSLHPTGALDSSLILFATSSISGEYGENYRTSAEYILCQSIF